MYEVSDTDRRMTNKDLLDLIDRNREAMEASPDNFIQVKGVGKAIFEMQISSYSTDTWFSLYLCDFDELSENPKATEAVGQ